MKILLTGEEEFLHLFTVLKTNVTKEKGCFHGLYIEFQLNEVCVLARCNSRFLPYGKVRFIRLEGKNILR